MQDVIQVTPDLAIPAGELDFRVSRASGPGGQGVNTTDSRVELRFDLDASPSLSDGQRTRLRTTLGGRIDGKGVLRVVAQSHRSQLMNRQAAVERFVALLADALRPQTPRRPTRPSRGMKEARLRGKAHRAGIKQQRRRPGGDWD